MIAPDLESFPAHDRAVNFRQCNLLGQRDLDERVAFAGKLRQRLLDAGSNEGIADFQARGIEADATDLRCSRGMSTAARQRQSSPLENLDIAGEQPDVIERK